jgi:L-Ala-D/L-Glu epimerase
MKILETRIYKLSIPMAPFQIATGTMHLTQNLLIELMTDEGLSGMGECSAFPMIAGETQSTCFEMAKDFAGLWKNKEALDIEERLADLDRFTAFNNTVKSAFDMALYDLAAKKSGLPLYKYLNGRLKPMETDLTIGIGEPELMAETADDFKRKGVRIIKIKLGKKEKEDIRRVQMIRSAVGDSIKLRVDANQGWDFGTAKNVLNRIADFDIEFCEQPMQHWYDHHLPELRRQVPVKIMADESIFNHHDALRLIRTASCDFINIKFAKSGGIAEALKICAVCNEYHVPCMMGGMLESRYALTAFSHFALSQDIIQFYDMDTCLLGHQIDPVVGGVLFRGYFLEPPEEPGIGADMDPAFLETCTQIKI